MSGSKPPYRVPLMREIEEVPGNGLSVVSTFSGGGGSCLGYRMAGYRVLYASEFIPEAQKTYRLNHPGVYLDTRDIRQVTPESILEIVGKRPGEIDLFDGSPPCCAFSLCGKREKGWGKSHAYSDKAQRVDDLFFEYTRLLKGLRPKVFVAENVKGLTIGTAKGYFKLILRALKECGYRVKAAVLNAQHLGVPQSRERLIFIGVRKDLNREPVYPKPLPYVYTLREAFEGLENAPQEVARLLEDGRRYKWGKVLSLLPRDPRKPLTGASVMNGSYFNLRRESLYAPCGTVCQMNGNPSACGNSHPLEDRKFTILELRRIMSIPDDFILTGTYAQQWERLGRMVPPVMMGHIAKTIEREILCRL